MRSLVSTLRLLKFFKFVVCGYCTQLYQKPKILPCLHSFCEQCINAVILAAGQNKESPIKSFACPLCRTTVEPDNPDTDSKFWASNLKDNIRISSSISVRNGEQQNCDVCSKQKKKVSACFWCKNCEEAFCEICCSYHNLMKLTSSHNVVSIDKLQSDTASRLGVSSIISMGCHFHEKKKVYAFCFEHKEPCCFECLTQKHRHCENVKPIEDIDNDFYENSSTSFQSLKSGIHQLLLLKQEQKRAFNNIMKTTEDDASKFTELIRCQIDSVFETYVKKLHTYKDEQNTKLNVQIRLLEQFEKNLEHWVNACAAVKDNGTSEQMFTYLETIKRQVRDRVEELGENCHKDSTICVQFLKNPMIEKLEKEEEIGSMEVEETPLVGQLDQIESACLGLGIKCYKHFENVTFEKKTDIKLPGVTVYGGLTFSDKHMVIACNKELRLMEKESEVVISCITGSAKILGLCLNKTRDILFTCDSMTTLYKTTVQDELDFSPIEDFANFSSNLGPIAFHDGKIFIVIDDAILICDETAPADIIKTIDANTCFDSTWIAVDNDYHFIMCSTFDHEVKGISFEGETVLNFRDCVVQRPASLTHFSNGMYLIISSTYDGSLHLLSSVDKSHKTLIENFDSSPNGLWVDKEMKAVYVGFDGLIERYNLMTTDKE